MMTMPGNPLTASIILFCRSPFFPLPIMQTIFFSASLKVAHFHLNRRTNLSRIGPLRVKGHPQTAVISQAHIFRERTLVLLVILYIILVHSNRERERDIKSVEVFLLSQMSGEVVNKKRERHLIARKQGKSHGGHNPSFPSRNNFLRESERALFCISLF